MDWAVRAAASFLLWLCIITSTIQRGNADRKIVCYYTNWSIYRPGTAKFSPQNINPYLCTHLIYAFGGFTKDNALRPFDKYQDIEKGGYAKFTGLKTYNKNLKTMLAIGGWNEGSSRFSPMVADPGRRREFVKNSVKFLRQNHFDGLDLDWEYPAFRDGGKPRDKDNYASLVQELSEEFDREASKTGRPRLLLSMAMPAGIEYIDKGYDVPKLNEYLDFINLLSYDYHSAYEPAVNHHSPLYPLEEDNEYNYDTELTIDYTIKHLLKKGASPEKIILGIPTYGRSYTLFNEDATDLGSPADGPGVEGDATREKGYLAYYEICESIAESDDWEVVQPNSNAMGPYAFKGNQWVGYDDEQVVKLKAKYVNERNLGGIMFWSIDNDDFRGKCHDRPYPLIEAAKETLLTGNTNSLHKPLENRKKNRPQGTGLGNSIARKLGSNARRSTTTVAPVSRKRPSSRPKYRTISRNRVSDEEAADREVERRSYSSSSNDDEQDEERGNALEKTETSQQAKNKSTKSRTANLDRRRKQPRKGGRSTTASSEESLSNKLTTPEPPTTPDPGSDFKCEDEGFFPHPRDCKKYFWCLDSGPGGLGVVAHQFTCPSGLVFNKAADSCDYPRNVICPKSKPQSSASTTKAPTTATSRTTQLQTSTRRTTTEKAESEEYEYYEDEDDDPVEEPEEEEEPKVITTPKPLLYKTITRNRPTTTTASSVLTTSRPDRNQPEKPADDEDEEDPRVIKELIDLIKKAGGIEQLEKQLHFQETPADDERVTPATISRSLYERVLSRQANRFTNNQRTTSTRTNYENGPGGAQFEGLDQVPEVKSLRRSQKPQYVTIERPKTNSREPPNADQEEVDTDNTDVAASSEEQAITNPFLARPTPNYVNIRRARPSSTTSRTENDVEVKDEAEEDTAVRRTAASSKASAKDENSGQLDSQLVDNEEDTPTTKSRYVNVQRFRSTTTKSTEGTSTESATESSPQENAPITTRLDDHSDPVTGSPSSSTTEAVVRVSSAENASIASPIPEVSSTTESVTLVQDSATEILLTTVPASSSQTVTISSTRTAPTISHPRPFGFTRRSRPTTSATVLSPTTSSSLDRTRSKVAISEALRLPTLKELIGTSANYFTATPSTVHLNLFFPLDTDDLSNLLNEIDQDDEKTNSRIPKTRENQFVLDTREIEDDALTNKMRIIRIDRADSTTTFVKPTTMRGMPLAKLRSHQVPRGGFYITRSDSEPSLTTETPTTATDSGTLAIEEKQTTTSLLENERGYSTVTDDPNAEYPVTTLKVDVKTSDDYSTTVVSSRPSTSSNLTVSITSTTTAGFPTPQTPAPLVVGNYQFGSRTKGSRRTASLYRRVDSEKETESREYPRRRVIVHRGRQRRPSQTTESKSPGKAETTKAERDKIVLKAMNVNDEVIGEEHPQGPPLRVVENVERPTSEANPLKTTGQPVRTPGNLLATRLRKTNPSSLSASSQRNKLPIAVPNYRTNRPVDETGSPPNEKFDNTDEVTVQLGETKKELGQRPEPADQSSRAQELAVTLADPATSQSSITGRLPALKDTLRRKISTTVAPRTESTTSRTTLRFSPIVRERQRPKTRDRHSLENSTTRPRRPAIIDYDYYEDEEEPVIAKSTFNGKLFLTSKGTIKCLDQGNFPHPYSCKKFITCARMVNGQVTGAEYTCPDKLSFDPVGGICNWSAGLGCKE